MGITSEYLIKDVLPDIRSLPDELSDSDKALANQLAAGRLNAWGVGGI